MSLIYFLIVGLIAGVIASYVMGRQQDLLINLLIGVVGAVVGGFLQACSALAPMACWVRSSLRPWARSCAFGSGSECAELVPFIALEITYISARPHWCGR